MKRVAKFGAKLRSSIMGGRSVAKFWRPAARAAYLRASRKANGKVDRRGNSGEGAPDGSLPECEGERQGGRQRGEAQLREDEIRELDEEMHAWVADILKESDAANKQAQKKLKGCQAGAKFDGDAPTRDQGSDAVPETLNDAPEEQK
eukprot:evm.model.scf_419EXC.1 EVM.evm.TU.scf_419EXC.1   scf_419EXC:3089-4060(-)